MCILDSRDEEGILAGAGTCPFVFSAREDPVVWIEVEDIRIGVVALIFCGEGGCYAVCEL